jgi:hypothetical protein
MDINVVFSLVPRHFSPLTVTNPWGTAAFTSTPATGVQAKKGARNIRAPRVESVRSNGEHQGGSSQSKPSMKPV